MSDVNVQLHMSPQARDLAGRFARANEVVDQELVKAAQQWGATALASLREATPSRTGQTKAAWRADWSPTQRKVTITNRKPTAVFLLEGTKPHLIQPRELPGFLSFLIEGERVFARRVHHPGTKPSSELNTAIVRLHETTQEELEQAGVRIVQRLGG